jgi:hypothetical protein
MVISSCNVIRGGFQYGNYSNHVDLSGIHKHGVAGFVAWVVMAIYLPIAWGADLSRWHDYDFDCIRHCSFQFAK